MVNKQAYTKYLNRYNAVAFAISWAMLFAMLWAFTQAFHLLTGEDTLGLPFLAGLAAGIVGMCIAQEPVWPPKDGDGGNIAKDGKISVTQAKPPLGEFFPNELEEAEEIDWDALCNEIDRSRRQYELPTPPDGEDGPWLDKFAVCQDVARFVRDGGSINVDRVIES